MCLNCHVVTVDIEMTDLNAIKAACQRLGWKFCEGQQEYRWWGHWVDDSPVPRHLFTDEAEYKRVVNMPKHERKEHMNGLLGKCAHAIKVPGCSYEIGILDQGNKLVPIWDWVAHDLHTAIGQKGGTLVQAYAVEKAKLEAMANCHSFTETVDEKGTVTLRVNIPSY